MARLPTDERTFRTEPYVSFENGVRLIGSQAEAGARIEGSAPTDARGHGPAFSVPSHSGTSNGSPGLT
jgi:hypothetical protein